MSTLAGKRCDVCFNATRPLTREEFEPFSAQVTAWTVVDDQKLHRTIKTKNFVKALELANKIGALAEEEQHHPDLLVRWGELKIDIWTHKVDGLTEADFVLAAKIDLLCPT
ncbi:MAG: 4a-hydroxytetrahydrobiopterin dehydratase [Candidatus Obscuribacterales bacterium]|nr:4a-hydroxytetrahydrobiopterin dehydratase [Candidatus Obscuribacterales bacterium]